MHIWISLYDNTGSKYLIKLDKHKFVTTMLGKIALRFICELCFIVEKLQFFSITYILRWIL